ncbi:MAG: hypothetical protein O3C40_01945 [Planctomycetota bacterium]|nr:hypothetical protein [Planctomycetota bacterium]
MPDQFDDFIRPKRPHEFRIFARREEIDSRLVARAIECGDGTLQETAGVGVGAKQCFETLSPVHAIAAHLVKELRAIGGIEP